ncbi:MAG: TerC/Alx family metal homeostasis membrane protein [Acidobacteriota bacterium]
MVVWLWIAFIAGVLLLLALDLGVFNRTAHVVTTAEALGWSAFWISLALAFNAVIGLLYEHHLFGIGLETGLELSGRQAALQFFTGYLIEKSLSLDNIFVIALILAYFHVPQSNQHRLLFWGVLGALVMRGCMIGIGATLILNVSWIVYAFGGILLLTSAKMLVMRHHNVDPGRNPLVPLVRRLYPVSGDYVGAQFFTRVGGRRAVTPMALALIVVETSDLLFAVDSVPAVFAVTRDPFLVYTSNIFAILGLRSLYFLLASVMDKFRYLKFSLVFILAFVGIKMLISHYYAIPTFTSLAIIVGLLMVGILASLLGAGRGTAALKSPLPGGVAGLAQLTYQKARKMVVLIIGATLLLIGVALLVLPGPGTLIILIGLALLATEFVWARRLLRKLKQTTSSASSSFWGWFRARSKE